MFGSGLTPVPIFLHRFDKIQFFLAGDIRPERIRADAVGPVTARAKRFGLACRCLRIAGLCDRHIYNSNRYRDHRNSNSHFRTSSACQTDFHGSYGLSHSLSMICRHNHRTRFFPPDGGHIPNQKDQIRLPSRSPISGARTCPVRTRHHAALRNRRPR